MLLGSMDKISHDTIADRQEPLQRAEDLLRATVDWTWAVDRRGYIQHVSEGLTRLSSRPAASARGRCMGDIGVWAWPYASDLFYTSAFQQAQAFRDFKLDLVDNLGRARRQRLCGVPVFDPETGAFTGFHGTALDQSSHRRLEWQVETDRAGARNTLDTLRQRNIELDSALQEAQAADRAKTRFLAQMSHELRTPLNGIIAYADAVNVGAIRPDLDKYAEIIGQMGEAGRHLLSMISDMIDLAAVERETITLETADIDIGDAIDQALAMVRMEINRRHIDARCVQTDSNHRVRADRRRLVQVLVNLLQNALKYGGDGGVIGVDIRSACVNPGGSGIPDAPDRDKLPADLAEGTWIDITVWDSGPGIPADKRERIFDAFTRGSGSQNDSGCSEGLGLGLAVSRKLVRAMNGDLWVTDSPMGGAAFVVRLPGTT